MPPCADYQGEMRYLLIIDGFTMRVLEIETLEKEVSLLGS
jgi:hypothetical protein